MITTLNKLVRKFKLVTLFGISTINRINFAITSCSNQDAPVNNLFTIRIGKSSLINIHYNYPPPESIKKSSNSIIFLLSKYLRNCDRCLAVPLQFQSPVILNSLSNSLRSAFWVSFILVGTLTFILTSSSPLP